MRTNHLTASISLPSLQTSIAKGILDFHYWYSRSTTVGISLHGTTLIIFGLLAKYIIGIAQSGYGSGRGLFGWVFLFITHSPSCITGILMLMAITRAELTRNSVSWIPRLQFSGATHAERASLRVDARTQWRHRATVRALDKRDLAYVGHTTDYSSC